VLAENGAVAASLAVPRRLATTPLPDRRGDIFATREGDAERCPLQASTLPRSTLAPRLRRARARPYWSAPVAANFARRALPSRSVSRRGDAPNVPGARSYRRAIGCGTRAPTRPGQSRSCRGPTLRARRGLESPPTHQRPTGGLTPPPTHTHARKALHPLGEGFNGFSLPARIPFRSIKLLLQELYRLSLSSIYPESLRRTLGRQCNGNIGSYPRTAADVPPTFALTYLRTAHF
jgi:hypothetical protein